jgi:RNA polymerase sigma-70 factor (ECF subfamily)
MIAAKGGDRAAFQRIVETYQAPVFGLLRRILGPAAAIEDIAQETFIRLWRARERYQPTGRLSTYLYRISYNLALNNIRDRNRKPTKPLPVSPEGTSLPLEDTSTETPFEAPDRESWSVLVESALQKLPENQRSALVFQHFDDFDLNEIGEVLGISPKAAKSLCHRARENMRLLLAPYREAEND